MGGECAGRVREERVRGEEGDPLLEVVLVIIGSVDRHDVVHAT